MLTLLDIIACRLHSKLQLQATVAHAFRYLYQIFVYSNCNLCTIVDGSNTGPW